MENEANFSMIMLLNFISTRQFFISLSKNYSARPLLNGNEVLEWLEIRTDTNRSTLMFMYSKGLNNNLNAVRSATIEF